MLPSPVKTPMALVKTDRPEGARYCPRVVWRQRRQAGGCRWIESAYARRRGWGISRAGERGERKEKKKRKEVGQWFGTKTRKAKDCSSNPEQDVLLRSGWEMAQIVASKIYVFFPVLFVSMLGGSTFSSY